MQIEQALSRRFGAFRREGGNECVVTCPTCGREKLYVNSLSGCYLCFKCGLSGCVFLRRDRLLRGLPIRKVVAPEKPKRKPYASCMPCDREDDCVDLGQVSVEDAAGAYVVSRFGAVGDGYEMKRELDAYWGVQYCRRGRKFADGLYDTTGTLVFPIDNASGECVAWQSRMMLDPGSIDDPAMLESLGWVRDGKVRRPPKYFTAPGWEKGSTLYNISEARKGDLIILTEGVFDVFAAGRSAVCAFGKAGLSDTQRLLLKAWSKCIVLLLDPDAADEQARLAEELADDKHVVVPVALKGYKDPGEAGRREVVRQVRGALEARGLNPDGYKWHQEAPGEGLAGTYPDYTA